MKKVIMWLKKQPIEAQPRIDFTHRDQSFTIRKHFSCFVFASMAVFNNKQIFIPICHFKIYCIDS